MYIYIFPDDGEMLHSFMPPTPFDIADVSHGDLMVIECRYVSDDHDVISKILKKLDRDGETWSEILPEKEYLAIDNLHT